MAALLEGIAYGPVRSRRGVSLGINIFPRHQKICTFNCSYCQYGWTRNHPGGATSDADSWPEPSVITRNVTAALQRIRAAGQRIDGLLVSGHGECTLHPQFAEVASAIFAMRDELLAEGKVAVVSNSTTLSSASVRAVLGKFDERIMKLDAGDATVVRRVNGASPCFDDVLSGLKQLKQFAVRSMFVCDRQARVDNSGDLAVAAWIGALRSIRPERVEVHTLERSPAWPYLQPVATPRLIQICRSAAAAGLNVELATPQGSAAQRRRTNN